MLSKVFLDPLLDFSFNNDLLLENDDGTVEIFHVESRKKRKYPYCVCNGKLVNLKSVQLTILYS